MARRPQDTLFPRPAAAAIQSIGDTIFPRSPWQGNFKHLTAPILEPDKGQGPRRKASAARGPWPGYSVTQSAGRRLYPGQQPVLQATTIIW